MLNSLGSSFTTIFGTQFNISLALPTAGPLYPKLRLVSNSFRSLASKASPADIRKVCVCTQKAPNLRSCLLKRHLTNTGRRHLLVDDQLSSLYAPPPSFGSFGAAFVMLCCFAPPASSSNPYGRLCTTEYRSGRKHKVHSDIFVAIDISFIFSTRLFRFEVRLELYGVNAAPRR